MRVTPEEAWAGMAAGLLATSLTVGGLIWRLSAWHTRLESRLEGIERSVRQLERYNGIRPRPKHRARR